MSKGFKKYTPDEQRKIAAQTYTKAHQTLITALHQAALLNLHSQASDAEIERLDARGQFDDDLIASAMVTVNKISTDAVQQCTIALRNALGYDAKEDSK